MSQASLSSEAPRVLQLPARRRRPSGRLLSLFGLRIRISTLKVLNSSVPVSEERSTSPSERLGGYSPCQKVGVVSSVQVKELPKWFSRVQSAGTAANAWAAVSEPFIGTKV